MSPYESLEPTYVPPSDNVAPETIEIRDVAQNKPEPLETYQGVYEGDTPEMVLAERREAVAMLEREIDVLRNAMGEVVVGNDDETRSNQHQSMQEMQSQLRVLEIKRDGLSEDIVLLEKVASPTIH